MHNIRNVVVSFLQEWRLFFAPCRLPTSPIPSTMSAAPSSFLHNFDGPPLHATVEAHPLLSLPHIILFLPWHRSTPPLHASYHVSFPSNPSMVSRTSSSLRHVVADLLLFPTTSHATHILLSPPSRVEHSLASPQGERPSPPISNPPLSYVKTATVFL